MSAWLQQPRARRLRWWWHCQLGWPGSIALVLLAAALLLGAGLRPWTESQRRELLREQIARLEAQARARAAAPAVRRDPRDALRDALPTLDQRGRVIADFLAAAARAQVPLAQAEYALEEQEPALSRLRISVPVSDSYARVRGLIGTVLESLPNAALDSLEMEAAGGEGAALDSRLQFSLWFRREVQP
ncbi:MAG: hypothetical protein JSR75_21630 [Proteobacteria bacterium]|nr:hypothetical protein [Pseudomonadota bacterium]